MKLLADFVLDTWRWTCGLPPTEEVAHMPDLDELKRTEWDVKFEMFMRNRLVVGAFRYGFFWDPGTNKYDRLKGIEDRLIDYRENGNDELLVDIANLCMKEFAVGNHPNKHFAASDDKTHHVQLKGARI